MNVIGIKEQADMKAASEREPTVSEKDLAAGIPVQADPTRGRVQSQFDEPVEEEVMEAEQVTLAPTITPDMQMLLDVAAEHDAEVINVRIKPRATVVIGVIEDGVNEFLNENPTLEANGKRFNVLQSLHPYSTKSRREGVMTAAIQNTVEQMAKAKLEEVRLVVGRDIATAAITDLLDRHIGDVSHALFEGFPVYSGEIEGEERAFPYLEVKSDDEFIAQAVERNWPLEYVGSRKSADEPVVFTTMFDLNNFVSHEVATEIVPLNGEVKELELNLHHIIHLRVPVFLRLESARIESTLNGYYNSLISLGQEHGIDVEVVLAVPSKTMFEESTWNLMGLVRENFKAVQPLTATNYFREVVGSVSTSTGSYESALYDKADFLIPLVQIEETDNE